MESNQKETTNKTFKESYDIFLKQYFKLLFFLISKTGSFLKNYIPLLATYGIFSWIYLTIYNSNGFNYTLILMLSALILSLLRMGGK